MIVLLAILVQNGNIDLIKKECTSCMLSQEKCSYLTYGDLETGMTLSEWCFVVDKSSGKLLGSHKKFSAGSEIVLDEGAEENSIDSIFLYDLDGNGIEDLVITNYPLGATGISANFLIFNFVFVYKESIKLYMACSFAGGPENLVDVDRDGVFEFFSTDVLSDMENVWYAGRVWKFDGKGGFLAFSDEVYINPSFDFDAKTSNGPMVQHFIQNLSSCALGHASQK